MHHEPLEPRLHLAVPANVNVSRVSGNQSEVAIVVKPTDPQRLFAFSNEATRPGMFAATSADGGRTWSRRFIAKGSPTSALPAACCDPTAAWDDFGNLFIAYVDEPRTAMIVAVSADNGATFRKLKTIRGDIDQPTLAVGPGSLWITYGADDRIRAAGAAVTGLNKVGAFRPAQNVPSEEGSNFGDIAIGPDGQVLVTYQSPIDTDGPSSLYVSLDPDGLGPKGFRPRVLAAKTAVGGFRDIPAQPDATIDAEVGLAYDRSAGPARGRVYMVYTHASAVRPNDTTILLRTSTNDGATWSKPTRLDTDTRRSSQFLPRIALDQTSGDVAVTWHDARNDTGVRGPNSTNDRRNDDAQYWGVFLRPTAASFIRSDNLQISAGTSSAPRADNGIDFGDYTGLAFHAGVAHPSWADNSNSTRDNPSGRLRALDIYTARVPTPFA